jgi:hypothetical protein
MGSSRVLLPEKGTYPWSAGGGRRVTPAEAAAAGAASHHRPNDRSHTARMALGHGARRGDTAAHHQADAYPAARMIGRHRCCSRSTSSITCRCWHYGAVLVPVSHVDPTTHSTFLLSVPQLAAVTQRVSDVKCLISLARAQPPIFLGSAWEAPSKVCCAHQRYFPTLASICQASRQCAGSLFLSQNIPATQAGPCQPRRQCRGKLFRSLITS